MSYPAEQIEGLKLYCNKLSAVAEGGMTYFFLESLRLPDGCDPPRCDALLCPFPKDGYPSRLYLASQVGCGFTRNWNSVNVWATTLCGVRQRQLHQCMG
jgi:hypothetical protein